MLHKHIFSVLAVLLICYTMPLHAQNSQVRPFIHGGYQGSTISGAMSLHSGFRVGAGLDVLMGATDQVTFGFLPSVNFATKGAKVSVSGGESISTTTLDLYYIDTPLLLDAFFKVNPDMGFHLNAGPYAGFLVKGEKDPDNTGLNFQNFDYGLQVGGGMEYSGVMLMAGLQWGLQKITKIEGDNSKNRSFFITVGYKF